MIESNSIYHIYNQGNNQETIFQERADYIRFLDKVRQLVMPNAAILAYCLMPNHFHFMVYTNSKSVEKVKVGNIQLINLTNGFRVLLSEYAKEYNQKYHRSGSLFRAKTKYKLVDNGDPKYAIRLLQYILVNPLTSSLVKDLNKWDFSNYKDLIGIRNGTLCDKTLLNKLIGVERKDILLLNSPDFGSRYFEEFKF